MGPIDENDQIEYSLSVSEGGEFWARLGATVRVREGENGVQAADRAVKFVDGLLAQHVQALNAQLRPK